MTYQELKKKICELDRKADAAYSQQYKLRRKYIQEHEPLHAKCYQRMTIRLRVTEKSRKRMSEKERSMRKYQLGNEYTVTGIFTGYALMDDGDIRPCFYGNVSYSRYDEIISVELTKHQPEGNCRLCRCYKDGLCYMNGGQTISKSCAIHKVEDGDVVCPKYEEVLPNGLYKYGEANKHCPNVTIAKNSKGNNLYRVYSLYWNFYTEYTEAEIWKFYTIEPKEKPQDS